jgi:hypothetical protein
MNTKSIAKWMLMLGTVAMLSGCASWKEGYDRRAASVNPYFPPATITPENSPQLYTTGAVANSSAAVDVNH